MRRIRVHVCSIISYMIIEKKKKKIFDKLKIFEFKEKNKLWLTSKKLTLATTKKRKSSKMRLQFLLIFYLTINIGAL